ncbi:glycoside hydrolase family 3 N-terminal domain-containing protein [Microbacterium atlanticum]|uniref:glycoside hydrolase family 3 N-terminal domain-containing protein n=1 Tax=Microbacterium atlanticum TaxID=2782168 RepID=UPI001E36F2C0|nr:glycoside hydrolase family 3 N-terminal domain-containing protein [Microbacterium atlanticum]
MMSSRRATSLAAVVVAAIACASCAPMSAGSPARTASPPAASAPSPTPTPEVEVSPAEEAVAAMTLRERAASVVMGHIPTTDPAVLHSYMAGSGIGGFLLMGANVPADEAALRQLTASLTVDPARPPLVAVDQEGGDVARLHWDGLPAPYELQQADPSASEAAYAERAALLSRSGVTVNFGIVADVSADPGSFIHRRVLGTTPDAGAERVSAAVAGERGVVFSTLKHFPGHGAAPGDSHATIPTTGMTLDQWRAADALPFVAGIDAGAELLMFGHLAYTAVDPAPASLSAAWHRIARDELGFGGVAVTDDLGMLQASGIDAYRDPVATAVAALAAGNDMVLTVVRSTADTAPQTVDGIVAAVESGALPAERLDEAAERVTELRLAIAEAGSGTLPCTTCEPAG